jgi:hypothetical protein
VLESNSGIEWVTGEMARLRAESNRLTVLAWDVVNEYNGIGSCLLPIGLAQSLATLRDGMTGVSTDAPECPHCLASFLRERHEQRKRLEAEADLVVAERRLDKVTA